MKKVVLATMLCFSLIVNCVAQTLVGKNYIVDVPDTKIYGITANDLKDSASAFLVKSGAVFTVIDVTPTDDLVILFWDYPGGTPITTKEALIDYTAMDAYINEKANGKHFIVDVKTLDRNCDSYYGIKHQFTWGAATIPVKLRFGDGKNKRFGMEQNINLGLGFGYRGQFNGRVNHAINIILNPSVSNVRLTKDDIRDAVEDPESNSALAFTMALGILYQFESFQVGLFHGYDFIPSALGKKWRNQGEPWVGIGIGFSLFSKNDSDASSQKQPK